MNIPLFQKTLEQAGLGSFGPVLAALAATGSGASPGLAELLALGEDRLLQPAVGMKKVHVNKVRALSTPAAYLLSIISTTTRSLERLPYRPQ